MNFEDFMRQGEVRVKMQDYRRKKDRAVEAAIHALKSHEKPYVSVSGGKDSIACAYIVDCAAREAGKDFVLWSHMSDASFPGTEETIRALSDHIHRRVVFNRSESSAFDLLKNPPKRSFGKSGVFFDAIREWASRSGCDLCFTGVRAYESKRRMQAAKAHGAHFHSGAAGEIDVCNPITWFRLEDVAAALVEYHAPIHPIYYMQPIGTSTNKFGEDGFIRLGYITSRDLNNKGTIVFIRYNYPDLFEKLCRAWPDAKNYV